MALFQPSNITPSDLSGTGTIDATEDMAVTWQVNGTGNTPMTAYKIDIMRNDTSSTLLYSTGQITLPEPFYGADSMGNPEYFTATIAKEALSTAGVTNNAQEGYKLLITQWWSVADSVEQTSASAFIARTRPQISISNYMPEINTISYTFQGLYTQAQGDPIEWARWQISTGSGGTELKDTGRVYNMGKLETRYDGFISGNNYSVRLSGQTINGVEFDTNWQVFSAQYQQMTFDGAATACPRCDTDAIQVDFPSPVYSMGRGGGNWEIEQTVNGPTLSLPTQDDSVTWDNGDGGTLGMKAPFGFAWKGTLTDISETSTLLSMQMNNGMMTMEANSSGFTVSAGNIEIVSVSTALADNAQITLIIEPRGYTVTINGTEYTGSINRWQDGISSIALYGPQKCRCLWIAKGEFTDEQKAELEADETEYDARTQLLANFEDGLSAGAIRTTDAVTELLIYRQTTGETIFRKCATVPVGVNAFRDYSAVNGKEYKYYLYGVTENGNSTTVIASNAITPRWWNWTLVLCAEDEDGVYHVQEEYRFALDVSSGTESNNNKPSMQANFTKYPLRQPNTQSYRSSTLTSFAGRSHNGQYMDSIAKIQALRNVSTSTLAKFLKTRKGELIRVETGDPISMSVVDKYEQQPVRIGLPWVETGDAGNASVITTTDDAYWTLTAE